MSLIKRSNSKFWYVQFQIDHQTVIRSTRTTDRKVAEQVAAKIRAEAHAEIVLDRKKQLTLQAALEQFVTSKAGSSNHRNLVSQKRIVLRTLNGQMAISRINSATLEQFRQRRAAEGCGPQTIKHGFNCIVGALRMARKLGYACGEIEPPSIKIGNGRLLYLTAAEEHRLLAELDPRRDTKGLSPYARRDRGRAQFMQDNYDLVILLLDTGARYSEIANIRWDQIDLSTKSIRLWRPKVQNESIIFMTERAHEVFARRANFQRGQEFVFSSKAGGPRGYSASAIRKAIRRAGLNDCTIHTLRHTHASRLVQNGLNVYEVRAVLGHTDIRTTMRYAHLEQAAVTSRARDIINGLNRLGPEGEIR